MMGPERSAAWLAHQSGGLGVESSNLSAPTNYFNELRFPCLSGIMGHVSLMSQSDNQ